MNPVLCSAIKLVFEQHPGESFTRAQLHDAIHPPFEPGEVTEHELQQALVWLVQNGELERLSLYMLPEPEPDIDPEEFDNISF